MKLYVEKFMLSLIILFTGIVMHIFAITQIQEASLAGVSPRAVPIMVSRGVIIMALIMLIQAIVFYQKERGEADHVRSSVVFHRFPFTIFLLMVAYAVVMVFAGYFIASLTILPLIMFILKERNYKNYLILLAIVVLVYLIMDVVLNIPLPKIGLFGII